MTTAEARRANLEAAKEIRCRRARLKVAMKSGSPTLTEILMADKQWMARMQVRHLLLAVPGLGPSKVRRAMTVNQIGHHLTLENFCIRRRVELLCWLRVNYPSVGIGEPKK